VAPLILRYAYQRKIHIVDVNGTDYTAHLFGKK